MVKCGNLWLTQLRASFFRKVDSKPQKKTFLLWSDILKFLDTYSNMLPKDHT